MAEQIYWLYRDSSPESQAAEDTLKAKGVHPRTIWDAPGYDRFPSLEIGIQTFTGLAAIQFYVADRL
ncbi:MAG: hypothetical protein Q7R67_02545 [bacterium]|nr:hypothetical protein [bacterium]